MKLNNFKLEVAKRSLNVFACGMDLTYETLSHEFLAMNYFIIIFLEKNNTIVNIINQKFMEFQM